MTAHVAVSGDRHISVLHQREDPRGVRLANGPEPCWGPSHDRNIGYDYLNAGRSGRDQYLLLSLVSHVTVPTVTHVTLARDRHVCYAGLGGLR